MHTKIVAMVSYDLDKQRRTNLTVFTERVSRNPLPGVSEDENVLGVGGSDDENVFGAVQSTQRA